MHAFVRGEGAWMPVPMASRILAARFTIAVVLLLGMVLPAILRLSAASPAGAFAALAVTLSIASCGIAFGAVFRNARPFELALIAVVYVVLPGATVFDVGTAAATPLVGHLVVSALARLATVFAWPRLAQVAH